jgi:hypothetical protein
MVRTRWTVWTSASGGPTARFSVAPHRRCFRGRLRPENGLAVLGLHQLLRLGEVL